MYTDEDHTLSYISYDIDIKGQDRVNNNKEQCRLIYMPWEFLEARLLYNMLIMQQH